MLVTVNGSLNVVVFKSEKVKREHLLKIKLLYFISKMSYFLLPVYTMVSFFFNSFILKGLLNFYYIEFILST